MGQVRNISDHKVTWRDTTWLPGQDIDVPFWSDRVSGGGWTLGISIADIFAARDQVFDEWFDDLPGPH